MTRIALVLALLASSSSAQPIDEVRFTRWGRAELAAIDRRSCYLPRAELLALPLAPPPANGAAATRGELDELLRLQSARTREQREAIEQHRTYAGVCRAFFDRLRRSVVVAPRTRALLEHVEIDAMVAVFNAKRRFNRARPDQLEPRLKPSLPVPAHAAYPSGHALQGHLVARVLASLTPGDGAALAALGSQIGREREIAGLHYPSDSAASRALADALFERLERSAKFVAERDAARAEWPAPTTPAVKRCRLKPDRAGRIRRKQREARRGKLPR